MEFRDDDINEDPRDNDIRRNAGAVMDATNRSASYQGRSQAHSQISTTSAAEINKHLFNTKRARGSRAYISKGSSLAMNKVFSQTLSQSNSRVQSARGTPTGVKRLPQPTPPMQHNTLNNYFPSSQVSQQNGKQSTREKSPRLLLDNNNMRTASTRGRNNFNYNNDKQCESPRKQMITSPNSRGISQSAGKGEYKSNSSDLYQQLRYQSYIANNGHAGGGVNSVQVSP